LRLAVLGALWLYVGLSVFVLWRAAVLTPFSDELDWIARWYGLRQDHDWAAYLLRPHVVHRFPFTFALLDWDIRALHGTNAPLILSGALALAVMTTALAIWAARAAPEALKPHAAVVAAMLALVASNVLDAATPIYVCYLHGAALAVLAIVAAEGAEARALAWRGPLALLLAMAAGFGTAAALAVWPVLALGAVRRRRWAWLAAVLLLGAAYALAYLHRDAGAGGAGVAGALAQPLGAARLALGYLVLPWSRLLLRFAWLGGLAVGAAAVAAVWLRGGRSASAPERVACGLILFTLVTAAMAGLGRAGETDPANVPLRYAALVTPLHVGLLMLLLPWAGELWRANRRAAEALVAVVVLALTAQDAVFAAKVIRANDWNRELVADFKAGRRAPEMAVTVHPDLAHAQAVYARLARDGLFQHELHLKPPPPSR
jgi:hypothetical protein